MTSTGTETPDGVDYTKRLEVKFLHSIPLGRRAVFTHKGEVWMAMPLPKMRRFTAHSVRLIGKAGQAQDALMRLLARRPDLYPDLAPSLEVLASVQHVPAWAHDRPEPAAEKRLEWTRQVRWWANLHQHQRVSVHWFARTASKPVTVATAIKKIRDRYGRSARVELVEAAPGEPWLPLRLLVNGQRPVSLHPTSSQQQEEGNP